MLKTIKTKQQSEKNSKLCNDLGTSNDITDSFDLLAETINVGLVPKGAGGYIPPFGSVSLPKRGQKFNLWTIVAERKLL